MLSVKLQTITLCLQHKGHSVHSMCPTWEKRDESITEGRLALYKEQGHSQRLATLYLEREKWDVDLKRERGM